jgi:hypothetical protein
MQGAPKRQVNAEDMLAELKRALESSTRAPDAPLRSASTAPESSSPDRKTSRSQSDRESDRPAKANADKSIGQPTDLQKSARPSSRRWKLTAGGLALAGVAAVCASFALTNKAPDLPTHALPVAATETSKPQNEQTLAPSSDPGSAPAAFKPDPPNQAAALVTSHRIGPDGAPIATAPSTPAFTDSAPPVAEAPKTAAPSAASQAIRPDGLPIATAPSAPASPDSAPPLAEAPKTTAPSAASQAIKPDGLPIATAPSAPASPDSAPLAKTPKPNTTPTASASNETAEPSTPKIDSKKKPSGKPSLPKPRTTAKASVKPPAQAERQSSEPAPPKEAEGSPQPVQTAGNPTALAPVPVPSVQQRVADGMTHAFSYLVHLPGALVPHLGGPNPDAH